MTQTKEPPMNLDSIDPELDHLERHESPTIEPPADHHLIDPRSEMNIVIRNRRRATARHHERVRREKMLHLATLLPPPQKNLVFAVLEKGIKLRDLASIHNTTHRTMRRRLDRLLETLADPCFTLAAAHAGDLPGALAQIARAYWLEGMPLRDLARRQGITLHRVRLEVATARTLLASRALPATSP